METLTSHHLYKEADVPMCPRCGGEMTRISRGTLIKLFLSWISVKRYFCYKCLRSKWRF